MNPAGFLFGPNATVNVGGMVSFTSADYLKLADGARFNAIPNANADALLSASPVVAFGFLGSNPGAITVQGSQFTVTPGQSLSLVGGNITIQSGMLSDGKTVQPAQLIAQGGQINLASVASPGEVLAGNLAYAPNVNGQYFGALGSINISQQSHIDASGNGGGTVLIRGGQFLLDNSTISANVMGPGSIINGVESIGGGIDIQVSQSALIQNGAVVETNVIGNATPGMTYGGVHVKADRIEVIGTVTLEDALGGADPFATFTGIRSDVRPGSTGGNSGSITLEGNSVAVKNIGIVETITEGAGNAGNILVRASQDIDLDLSIGFQSAAHPGSTGDTGNVELSSAQGNITLTNFTQVGTQLVDSPGIAGHLALNAPAGNIVVTDSAIGTYIQPHVNQQGLQAAREAGSGALTITAKNLALNGGDIGITNLSIQPSGDLTISASGSLSLQGGSFNPSSSIHASAVGFFPGFNTSGPLIGGPSAGLAITAPHILMTSGSSLTTDTNSTGAAGSLNVSTQNLQLTNGSQIASKSRFGTDPLTGVQLTTPPSGPAGAVNIHGLAGAADSILIDGQGSGIFTTTVGTGAGGSVNILSHSLQIQNGGSISAATSGTAASATGGIINVKADTVTLTTGGTITAASTGPGASGEVVVEGLASPGQSILIDGTTSGILTNASGTGMGGDIHLSAGLVTLQNGGVLSAATSGTAPSATGGSITVNATNGVAINSGGSITASSTGPANAGNIVINAGPQLVLQNGSISTEAAQAGGGNIQIKAGNLVQLNNSSINTSVLGGGGSGGNITIDPNSVLLQNSQILAQAVQGSGGNISITTNLLLPDSNSTISASSQFGQNGTVVVQSPIAPASGKIIPLSQHPLIPVSLMTQRCAALAGGQFSSFTVAGRSTVPAEPAGWLSAPLAALGAGTAGHAQEVSSPPLPRWGRSGGEGNLLSLRQIAPPGFLTQSFAEDSSTGCTSTETGRG
jgi:large exoprotein involved in heme utilization and adhesion